MIYLSSDVNALLINLLRCYGSGGGGIA
eukprot:COSAG06_NODE_27792_length_586_cov_1.166324_2_plen_27_part_01